MADLGPGQPPTIFVRSNKYRDSIEPQKMRVEVEQTETSSSFLLLYYAVGAAHTQKHDQQRM